MELNDFLRKYNRCPFCEEYKTQTRCRTCKWRHPYTTCTEDRFTPTQEWNARLNREVTV